MNNIYREFGATLSIVLVKVVDYSDPSPPDWALGTQMFITDHPTSRAGHMLKALYNDSSIVGLDTEVPTWTYGGLSGRAGNWTDVSSSTGGVLPNTQGVYWSIPTNADGSRANTTFDESNSSSLGAASLSDGSVINWYWDIDMRHFWPGGRPDAESCNPIDYYAGSWQEALGGFCPMRAKYIELLFSHGSGTWAYVGDCQGEDGDGGHPWDWGLGRFYEFAAQGEFFDDYWRLRIPYAGPEGGGTCDSAKNALDMGEQEYVAGIHYSQDGTHWGGDVAWAQHPDAISTVGDMPEDGVGGRIRYRGPHEDSDFQERFYLNFLKNQKYYSLLMPTPNGGTPYRMCNHLGPYMFEHVPYMEIWETGGPYWPIHSWEWNATSFGNVYGRFKADWAGMHRDKIWDQSLDTTGNPYEENVSHLYMTGEQEFTGYMCGETSVSCGGLCEGGDCYWQLIEVDMQPDDPPSVHVWHRYGCWGYAYDQDDCEDNGGSWIAETTFEPKGLNGKVWGGTSYTGGYWTNNFGWAMHLANTVDWRNFDTKCDIRTWWNFDPYCGGEEQDPCPDCEGNGPHTFGGPWVGGLTNGGAMSCGNRDRSGAEVIGDSMFPPNLKFEGFAATSWSENLKGAAPYNRYPDYLDEFYALDQYKQLILNEWLICEIVDPNSLMIGTTVWVRKPDYLVLPYDYGAAETSGGDWIHDYKRVCPGYLEGDLIYVAWSHEDNDPEGGSGAYIDINADGRKVFDYGSVNGPYLYWDVFPDPYIPMETPHLIPPHWIDGYSYSCCDPKEMQKKSLTINRGSGGRGNPGLDGADFTGDKGDKGEDGEKGQKMSPADDWDDEEYPAEAGEPGDYLIGDPGEKGGKGDKGGKGEKADDGRKAAEPTASIDPPEYSYDENWLLPLSSSGNILRIPLGPGPPGDGQANQTAGEDPWEDGFHTIAFIGKKLGTCVEDDDYSPKYDHVNALVSDRIITY